MQNEKFKEKLAICRKRKYYDDFDNETIKTDEETFKTDYFLFIADQAISSLKSKFD